MSYRWGLSHNAYQHWSFIFDKELPIEIETEQSSISVAGYLRDVIKYAHQNKLKGADWFKKVTVSPITKDLVRITMKKRYVKINNYPTHGIFDLMEMFQSGQLEEHYKFVISDDCNDTLLSTNHSLKPLLL